MLIMGSPVVKWGEQVVHIQRKVPRALLYYLAGHPQAISRMDLCLLFWPDASAEVGRRRLREILSKLRADLPDPDVVIVSNDQISLDPNRVMVDLLEFRKLIYENRKIASLVARNEPLPFSVYQALSKAVLLWRGPRLLSGFDWPDSVDFDQWVDETNQMMDFSRQFVLIRLADHAVATSDLQDALHWLRLAAENDEHNSDLHYRILNTLAGLGLKNEITSYCNYLRQLYEDEGSMPAMIAQMCTKLQSQGVQHNYPLPAPLHPMFGRTKQIKQLRQAYQRGGVAALLGEAGAGKTRLSYEFFRSLEPAPRLFVLSCQENYRSLPFHPITSGLRQQIKVEEWQLLNSTWRANLSILLPELQTSLSEPSLSHKYGLDETRTQIFETLYQFASLMQKDERLLVVLDDAQWADSATIAALAYLAGRGLFSHPNFLIINSRLEDSNPELDAVLSNQIKSTTIELIRLPLLERVHILEFSQSVLGETLNEEQLNRLVLDTGGNPLYVLEWLRNWSYHRTQFPESTGANSPLSGSLLSLMRDRLNILNSADRQVVSVAAILGSPFRPDEVETVAELSTGVVTVALENLERAQLIHPLPDGTAYSFIHDKIREVLLMDLTVARRRMYHLRVASVLQQNSPSLDNPNAARIANHFEAGGEPARAIYAWVEAAIHAWHLFSKPEAEAAFQRAERIVKTYEHTLSDEAIYHLYYVWGNGMIESNNIEGMLSVFSPLFRYGEQRRNRLMMGVAQRGLANHYLNIGRLDSAREAANRSVLLLDTLPNIQERVDALYGRASISITLADFPSARQDLEAAIEISAHATDRQTIRSRSLNEMVLATLYTLTGYPAKGEKMGLQARQDAQRINSLYAESSALAALTTATYYQGKFSECNRFIDEGLHLSEPLHYWRNIGYLHIIKSFLFMTTGDLDTAWMETQLIQKIADEYGVMDLLAAVWLIRGNLQRYPGNLLPAIECYQQGQAAAIDFHMALENQAQLARALVELGRLEEGRNHYEQVLSTTRKIGLGLVHYRAACNWLVSRSSFQPTELTLLEADQLEKEVQNLEIAPLSILLNLSRAKAFLKAGDLERGLSYANLFNQEASRSDIAWLDFNNLDLQQQIATLTRQPFDPEICSRLRERLQHLNSHAQQPELRPLIEQFQAKVLEKLA